MLIFYYFLAFFLFGNLGKPSFPDQTEDLQGVIPASLGSFIEHAKRVKENFADLACKENVRLVHTQNYVAVQRELATCQIQTNPFALIISSEQTRVGI